MAGGGVEARRGVGGLGDDPEDEGLGEAGEERVVSRDVEQDGHIVARDGEGVVEGLKRVGGDPQQAGGALRGRIAVVLYVVDDFKDVILPDVGPRTNGQRDGRIFGNDRKIRQRRVRGVDEGGACQEDGIAAVRIDVVGQDVDGGRPDIRREEEPGGVFQRLRRAVRVIIINDGRRSQAFGKLQAVVCDASQFR